MNLHKLYIPGVVVLIVLLGYMVFVWLREHDARLLAEDRGHAAESVIAQKDQGLADRERQWQQQRDDFQRQIDGIKTLAQARQVLQPVLLPSSPSVEVKKQDLPASVQKDIPGAPDAKLSVLTEADVISLAKREKACQEAEAGSLKCQTDVKDWKDKFTASQQQVESWKTVAQGGKWVRRTLRVAVPVGCGAGGAWLANRVRSSGSAAAAGALSGGAACALAFRF